MLLSAMMKEAARQLATDVTFGPIGEAPKAVKDELIDLSLTIAAWADRVETMESELCDSRRRKAPKGLQWAADQFISGVWQGAGITALVLVLRWLVT